MLEFPIDNVFVVVGGQVFQQFVVIPTGTNCVPLLAYLLLYSHEADFIHEKKNLDLAFNSTFRYIDVLSMNNNQFHSYELEIKDTTECFTSAWYLDILLKLDTNGKLTIQLYDIKRDYLLTYVVISHFHLHIVFISRS
jgi:hypothetical protein